MKTKIKIFIEKNITDNTKPLKTFGVFLLFALVCLLIANLPFIVTGKSFVWDVDGVLQHCAFLKSFVQNGWLCNIGKYVFSSGLGSDFFTSYTYYSVLDPFTALFYILPWRVEITYCLVVYLKYMVCAITMFLFLRNKKVENKTNFVISVLYMLCGFAVFTMTRHPDIVGGVMYLPLIIMGIDKIFEKKNPYILILGIVLTIFSSFYMFYMSALFAVIYTLVVAVSKCKDENGKFNFLQYLIYVGIVACAFVVGILICSVVLLPTGVAYLNSARGGSKGITGYNLWQYLVIILGMLYSPAGSFYTSIGMSIPITMMFVLFVCTKSYGENKSYKILSVAMFVALLFPIGGYIFNLFNYVNNRWTFILSFIILSCVALMADQVEKRGVTDKEKINFRKCISILVAVIINFLFAWCLTKMWLLKLYVVFAILIPVIAALDVLLVFKLKKLFKEQKIFNFENKLYNKKLILTALLLFSLFGTFTYNIYYQSGSMSFTAMDTQTSKLEKSISELNEADFFRTDASLEICPLVRNNRPTVNNYLGTYFYNSVCDKNIAEFLDYNQVYNHIPSLGITGLGNRISLEALLSCKYYISENGVPYGFSETEIDGETVYLNNNYIPFGFTYDNVVSKEFADQLQAEEKQYLMLEAMIIDDSSALYSYTNKTEQLNYSINLENIELTDNVYHIKEKGAKIVLTVHNANNNELTLNLKDLNFKENAYLESDNAIQFFNGIEVMEYMVNSENFNYERRSYLKGDQLYYEQSDFSYCMGVSNTDDFTIEIEFNHTGDFTLGEINVAGYDVSQFASVVNNLKDETLQNVKYDGNGFSGNITLTEDKYMFFSVPYSSGWTAYVNGEKTEITKANVGFMALKLGAGENQIEFKYETPCLKTGAVASGVGLGILGLIVAFDVTLVVLNKRKNKKQKNNS